MLLSTVLSAGQLRGGDGADVALFDGGGGESRPLSGLLADGDGAGGFVTFDASAGAAAAVKAVKKVGPSRQLRVSQETKSLAAAHAAQFVK